MSFISDPVCHPEGGRGGVPGLRSNTKRCPKKQRPLEVLVRSDWYLYSLSSNQSPEFHNGPTYSPRSESGSLSTPKVSDLSGVLYHVKSTD